MGLLDIKERKIIFTLENAYDKHWLNPLDKSTEGGFCVNTFGDWEKKEFNVKNVTKEGDLQGFSD